MKKITGKIPDIIAIFLLTIIVIWNISAFLSLTNLPWLDPTGGQLPRTIVLKESIQKYADYYPLWNPFLNSGEPYTDASALGIDSLTGFLGVVMQTATGLNLSHPLTLIFAAIFMYFLAKYIFKDPVISFFVALTYSSTGYVINMLISGSMPQSHGYAITPLIILFILRAFREKNWVLNAVLAGIFLGIQMRVAIDMKVTLFLSLAVGAIFLVQLIRADIKKHILKITIIGILIIAIGAGLAAQKILVSQQTIAESSRAHLSFEESSLRKVPAKDFFQIAVQPISAGFNVRYTYDSLKLPNTRYGAFAMGIIATLLAAIGLIMQKKNRLVIAFGFVLLIAVLVVTASPFFYFLWKYIPPWSSFRYVERGFSIWALGICMLMGFGIQSVVETIKKKRPNIKPKLIMAVIGLMLILNLFVFNRAPEPGYFCPVQKILDSNQVINYIKEQPGTFRVHEWETRGIDWPTDPFVVNARLEHLYGYTGAWVPEYMNEYLNVAYQDPAKFWGVMNVKYISAMEPINVTGLRLIKTFDTYQREGNCPPQEVMRAFGPYLYENDAFVSRATIPSKTILIIGPEDAAKQVMYGIMLLPEFDPQSTALAIGAKTPIENNDIEFLKKFDAIILASPQAVSSQSGQILAQYAQNGGLLLPNILNGETTLNSTKLSELINPQIKGQIIADSDIKTINFQHKEIPISASTKYVVLSERYFFYDGWHARFNGKEMPIVRANGFVSLILLDGTAGTLKLSYERSSYNLGVIISMITGLGLAAYFAYELVLKHRIRFKKHKDSQE